MAAKRHSRNASDHVNPALTALLVPIDTLTLDPENARAHDDRNLAAIAYSLQQFGQQKPIVATHDGVVVAGNGMLQAARDRLGWKRIAALRLPSDDAAQARAFALADNRTAELSQWDDAALARNLAMLKEAAFDGLGNLGWTLDELDLYLRANWTPQAPTPGGLETEQGTRKIALTNEQFDVVTQAIQRVREREGDPQMTDGRALELVCADYLAGA